MQNYKKNATARRRRRRAEYFITRNARRIPSSSLPLKLSSRRWATSSKFDQDIGRGAARRFAMPNALAGLNFPGAHAPHGRDWP